ncbi:MAG: hypothetical protein HYV60_16330 [Planctomycetia bacterium]|nr:hypothetical protein [Planctomycetia bacterium]
MTTILNSPTRQPLQNRVEHSTIDLGTKLMTLRINRDTAARSVPLAAWQQINDGLEYEVENRIQAELKTSTYPAVRRVRCLFEEGFLTLRGTMPSYYCVQVAINLVLAASNGNVALRNCLQVVNASQA